MPTNDDVKCGCVRVCVYVCLTSMRRTTTTTTTVYVDDEKQNTFYVNILFYNLVNMVVARSQDKCPILHTHKTASYTEIQHTLMWVFGKSKAEADGVIFHAMCL